MHPSLLTVAGYPAFNHSITSIQFGGDFSPPCWLMLALEKLKNRKFELLECKKFQF